MQVFGGALSALAGNKARAKLSAERQKAAMPAVAGLLAQGLPQVAPESLSAVATEYDVPKKEFQSQLAGLKAPRRILETLEVHRDMSFAGEFDALREWLRENAQ